MVSLLQLKLSMAYKRVSPSISFFVSFAHLIVSGLNMGNDLAIFLVYNALLVDGNVLTNKLSIGGLTPLTGIPPPPPAIAAGIDHHGTFEGAIFGLCHLIISPYLTSFI